jgi:hypothetical protein
MSKGYWVRMGLDLFCYLLIQCIIIIIFFSKQSGELSISRDWGEVESSLLFIELWGKER